ncbi:MAG: tetraacyldisaccharide 4'-kinase [Planctomycetes bacterium]|nr:tetraacyldisaccharide 4'-kinase [Planctomycetota bacterium]
MKDFLQKLRRAYLRATLENAPGIRHKLIRGLTWLLMWPYIWAVKFRLWLYRKGFSPAEKFAIPVVSVGNITCGGTGKTPMVELAAKMVAKRWRRPAILSSGYHAWDTEEGPVTDECLLLRQNLPEVPQYMKKGDGIRILRDAIARNMMDCIILDDGFQNFGIRRDIDIIVVDALNPFSNEYVIPRGLLREPIEALARANAIVITRSNQVSLNDLKALRARIESLAPGKPVIIAIHKAIELSSTDNTEKKPVEWLAQRKIWAFCGIGNPESFRISLEKAGAKVMGLSVFSDHHQYAPEDLSRIQREAQEAGVGAVITTQKDGVKLLGVSAVDSLPLLVLKIEIVVVQGAAELQNNVLNL